MLELHKIIKISHAVACPIVFILFYDPDWQGGVLKHVKNGHIFDIFIRFCPFPKFLGRLMIDLY